jgi:hypothetical protein
MVNVRLDGSGVKECIAPQRVWLNLCVWLDLMARQSLPLIQIWYLTHLRTFGWTDHLPMLEQELLTVLSQDDLPKWVREMLWTLVRVVRHRTGQDETIQVVGDPS